MDNDYNLHDDGLRISKTNPKKEANNKTTDHLGNCQSDETRGYVACPNCNTPIKCPNCDKKIKPNNIAKT